MTNNPYQTIKESYTYPVTLSLPEWQQYIASGDNTLYGDAVYPENTYMNGAVIAGHVRQNPFTANYPYDSLANSYD